MVALFSTIEESLQKSVVLLYQSVGVFQRKFRAMKFASTYVWICKNLIKRFENSVKTDKKAAINIYLTKLLKQRVFGRVHFHRCKFTTKVFYKNQ